MPADEPETPGEPQRLQPDSATTSEVFASFLSRKLAGDEISLEGLLSEHPEKAAELRRLHESWSAQDEEPAARHESHPTQASIMDEFATEILGRLSTRESGFQRYEVEGELARGGQGAIVRVRDADLNRHLAMKVALGRVDPAPAKEKSTSSPADTRSVGRFLEEAQVTGQLDHPGIVPVHELGIDPQGHVYFTMKLVRGRDLRHIIDLVHEGKEGWTITRALHVLLKVCDSMAYAHSKGVMHRDLKPGNVMVGKYGEVYVMDWGLARIIGEEDRKNIRIRPLDPQMTSELHMEHRAAKGESPESPLITMDGDIVGTPAYMSPEQAVGDLERMGPHSDVYSVGAMLYHLLTGRVPYVPPGARLNNYVIWGLVQTGPPLAVHELASEVPAELVAICEKAMARDARDRYADMMELAEDLRAYLEHRVVKAYRTGAVAELRKWLSRNRSLAWMSAAALLLLIGGLGAVGYVEARGRTAAEREQAIARANEELARKNAAEARRQEEIARQERANVLRLSAFQNLEDLRARADELWPVSPALVPEYEQWLEEAHELLRELDFARAQRDQLRARARPLTAEESAISAAQHPRHAELVALRTKARALHDAQQVRSGQRAFEAGSAGPDAEGQSALRLDGWAWPLVDPQRVTFEEEAHGLALAKLAREAARTDLERHRTGITLAWAYFANGLDEEALETAWRVKEAAPPGSVADADRNLAELERQVLAVEDGALSEELEDLEAAIGELEAIVSERAIWTFENDEDRWWHDQLHKLVLDLLRLSDPETGLIRGRSPEHALGIERRLALARELERAATDDANRNRWQEAIASIADPDRCPAYRGLQIGPQLGLLPLGRDPESGLWEFVHVVSGSEPGRGKEGRITLEPEMGIVFVLLPGGTSWMGAQRNDPGRPNYDALARPEEGPVHAVRLEPFFMSKFELTQAQWRRIHGENPSTYASEPGRRWVEQGRSSDLNPVENVSWTECERALARLGCTLPTEAQWEYAARAGTQTSWWFGGEREGIAEVANTGDLAAIRWDAPWGELQDWLNDGYAIHAPIGSFPANPFGLHEVHGNAMEWCRELYREYHHPTVGGEAERTGASSYPGRVVRSGSFAQPYHASRSASRPAWEPTAKNNWIGIRPARRLER